MEQFKVEDMITKAVVASRSNYYHKDLVKSFIDAIRLNNDLFLNTNVIDMQNNNGFRIEVEAINRILDKYTNVESIIDKTDDTKLSDNLLSSNVYEKLGVLYVIFDGNTYTMLEMMILGLLTHNVIIFASDGYMGGSNSLLISIAESFFKKQKLDTNIFQQSLTIRAKEFFTNFKSIDKTVIIGDNEFVDKYLKECTTEVVVARNNVYDLYVEDLTHLDLLKEIVGLGLNVNAYVKEGLIDYEDAIYVADIDEAITNINYNGGKYSSSIFTNDSENAGLFIRDVKSKHVFVNTSPTIERGLDIKQEDLLREKSILLPNIYKFDGSKVNVDI